ncbi:MAG TPA: LecA/PA-IL family lectin, partial [Vicinamibacterales bacterium]
AEQGQEQRYAVRDVSRVYLNPQSARTALNFTGATNAVGTVGTQAPPGTVFVQANQAWTDTGIDVKRGDHYMFRSTGNIAFGRGPGQTADANGKVGEQSNAFPVPVAPVGALIGKVGNSAPFSIGANTQLPGIVMPQNGRLFLGVNDNELGDNSGAFTVAITKR